MVEKKGRAKPPEGKIKGVKELAELLGKYPVVGIIDLYKLPANALQKMRVSLRGKAEIKVAKRSIVERAFDIVPEKAMLKEKLGIQPAILFSSENPFRIFKLIQKSKSKASAKPGDIAIDDITVNAGPTDIPPGPAISALSKVKIPAKVEGGKIAVAKNALVAKKGDIISADLASALSMLKIQPMEIGMNVTSMLEGGVVYSKESLTIDEGKVLADLLMAAQHGINLSVNAGFPTGQTIELMLGKAYREAKNLGTEANILDTGIVEDVLGKAERQAKALQNLIKK